MDIPGIVIKLKEGDEQAFRDLFGLYRDRVFNTALGFLQHHENAEDTTQEVFIEIYRSITRFRGECELSTWIYRITVRKSLELLRAGKRKKRFGMVFSLFGNEHRVNIAVEAPFYHPGIRLENRERSAILFKAIEKLPLNQRTAFVLHKVEGLPQAEIANIMGTSVSSVESLIVRALRNLRRLLSDFYEQNEK